MTTLDFELEIGPGAAGSYPVAARAPGGGEAATTRRWSLTPDELDHQLDVIKKKVLLSSAAVRRAATEDEQPVQELGQRLFEAVIADRDLQRSGRHPGEGSVARLYISSATAATTG